MINRLYGMLAQEVAEGDFYYRKSTQPPAYTKELDILVPASSEDAYRRFCADQLCAICFEGALKDILLQLDPDNTYEYPTDPVTEALTEISGVPENVVLNVNDVSIQTPWVDKRILLSFDGATTVTYENGKTVEWGATGTPLILVDGIALSFSGAAPASAFTTSVTLQRKPYRDIIALYRRLEAESDPVWTSTLEPYRDATVPSTKLAAHVLNALAKI
jgi:hypothetical protein